MINILIIIFVLTYISLLIFNKPENKDIPTVKFPFKNLFDDKGNKLNVILIAAPFREKKHEDLYKKYKSNGMSFAGISSYLEFPKKIHNPYEDKYHETQEHNYTSMVDTWLHCFREPMDVSIPQVMLTEADLKDTESYAPNNRVKKEYDFMYVCLKDNDNCEPGWQSYNRNWELAKECLKIMCSQYNLKGVIVGRENCKITEFCDGIVKILPFLSFHKFQKELQKCRFLFVPNISDASPRVITEALCYNIPVLVNENIVGGWHNVIPHITGEFFNDETDIIYALDYMTKNINTYSAREWFIKNRGNKISGRILASFLIQHYPNLNNKTTEYVTITI
jgi:hypothetical protein